MHGQEPAVVGAQTRINGSVEGTADLTIAGRVEGRIQIGEVLTVEPSGIVIADVDAKRVIVHGTVVGDIVASEAVQVSAQGRLVGDVYAPRFALAPGGGYRGTINMEGTPPPRKTSRPEAGVAKAEPAPKVAPASKAAASKAAASKAAPVQRGRVSAKRHRPPTAAGRKSRAKRK